MIAEAQADRQESADCTFVLAVGDGLASDPELARWITGGGNAPFVGSLPFDAVVLSDADLVASSEQGNLSALSATGLPLVSSNVVRAKTAEPLVASYLVKECRGHRVAFLGLTQDARIDGVSVLSPLEALKHVLEEIGGQADVVVLLSNVGLEKDRDIASQVEGIDIIVGGGASPLDEPEFAERTGTLMVRAGYPGRSVGLARLSFDPDGRLQHQSWERRLFFPSE